MSNSLVPKKDAGSNVVNAVVHDGVTVGVTVATIVVYSMVPVFGWAVLLAGGGYVGYRAIKNGLKKR